MVLIEMCYCKITGKTRDLPPVHHFIPLEPYEVKRKGKKARMKSVIEITNSAKPNTKNNRREQIKLVLDMSNDGPMFKMLESMLGSVSGNSVTSVIKMEALKGQLISECPFDFPKNHRKI